MKESLFKQYNNQRWSFVNYNQDDIASVSKAFSLSESLARVLIHNARETSVEKLKDILEPDPYLLDSVEGLCDPAEMTAAVNRIRQVQKKNESIFINGDPDADGIGGTAILVSGLRHLGIQTDYVFPIRPTEGHGLQVRIIDEAKDSGASLVITTDCGTKDIEVIRYAQSIGIDVIVTDHHILGHEKNPAVALINPNTYEGDSMCKALSGASVAYKFIQALYQHLDVEFPEFLHEFSLIASALGSISDRVSMLNPLNRLIVKHGIQYFFESEREGIKALRDISIPSGNLSKPRHLSRTIIPRLNAPGRIGNPDENIPDASIVVDILILGKGKRNKTKAGRVKQLLQSVFAAEEKARDKESEEFDKEAYIAASDVDTVNEKRKFLTAQIEDEMESLLETQVNVDDDKIIILEGKNWNSGVIGIDADRLKERFLRPAIILNYRTDSDYVRGSARSIPRIDIYALIDHVEQKFEQQVGRKLFQMHVESQGKKNVVNAFGGHSQACGFVIHKDDVAVFKTMIHKEAEGLKDKQFEYHYDVVDQLSFFELKPSFITELDRFSPYGQHFEFPTFCIEKCRLKGGRSFGNRYRKTMKQHVQFKVVGSSKQTKNMIIDAVGFGLWEKFCYLREHSAPDQLVDLIFMIELNPRSKSKKQSLSAIRLNVLDIRVSKDSNYPEF